MVQCVNLMRSIEGLPSYGLPSYRVWCRLFLLLALGTNLLSSTALGNPQALESPTEVVRTTLTAVFQILDDQKLKDPTKHELRRRTLEAVIAERFDYAEMSKRALAAHWTSLSTEQRTEFVELFKSFLSDRYAGKIEGYSGERVQYLSERVEGQYAEVRTRLVSSKVDIPMDYRLINKERPMARIRHHR